MRRSLVLAVAIGVLASGCATHTRDQSLTTTLSAYGGTLRWGDFQSALGYVDPKVLAKHSPSALDMARYQQVRVTEYDDSAGPVPTGPDQVQQVVRIDLVNLNTQIERTVIDRQTWHYDAAHKRWWLESGLPDITQQ